MAEGTAARRAVAVGRRDVTSRIIDLLACQPVLNTAGESCGRLPAFILDSPIVEADEVARWYWESEREVWDYESQFGPLRPPFDNMLVIWRMPARCYVEGEWRNRGWDESAAWVSNKTSDDGTVGVYVHSILRSGNRLVALPTGDFFDLDSNGSYVRHRYWSAPGFADAHSEGAAMSHVPMLAISFMHCSNVRLDEVERQPRGRKRGPKPPARRHTVIRLPSTIRKGQRPTRDALGAVQPLHLVRGHFKTFTEEAPLFGSRVGTYWWNPATRGSSDAGQVDHTYEVSPS